MASHNFVRDILHSSMLEMRTAWTEHWINGIIFLRPRRTKQQNIQRGYETKLTASVVK